jgi:hypothetical protein
LFVTRALDVVPIRLGRLALAVALITAAVLAQEPESARADAVAPLIQQGPKLTAGEEIGEGVFGESVALAADGNTALIGGGADNGNDGAAWVFTRSGGVWKQQGPKLTGGGQEQGTGGFGGAWRCRPTATPR